MRIDTVNITIHQTQHSPFVSALLSAIRSGGNSETPGDIETAAGDPPPAIGQAWASKGGIYAGVARGFNGEPDGHLVLLDDKSDGKLKWKAAVEWAQGLGDGARLPKRFESALLYANLQDQFDADYWHWTGTAYSEGSAWIQNFNNGYQDDYGKSFEALARAVRRFPL